ncbi:class I SAM-dependent methyltransferase [Blautia schinkii]|nr:class I SAM-dependent methyltransferase [Blautia schinkii]
MNSNIIKALGKPPVYTKTTGEFWNDEHISKQMLKAHLNPEFDGASRRLDFIEKSVAWIKELVPHLQYSNLLDVGCGPGIYAEKFVQMGYHVTGIDFSKRSIDYARQSAISKGLEISYLYQDYLEMDLKEKFDFATMIYCDYGALSTKDRQVILSKIHHHLKPGGKLLLDVFSMIKFEHFQERQTWEICNDGGFWREDEYVALSGYYKYLDNVTLDQILVISKYETAIYYIWNTYFTKETLTNEVQNMGFKVCEVFSDVAGDVYRPESETIAILLERK